MSTQDVLSLSSHEGSEEDKDLMVDEYHDDHDKLDNERRKGEEKQNQKQKQDAIITTTRTFIDRIITKYAKFSSSSVFNERGLKLVQWVMWLCSQMTKNNQRFHKELSPSLRKIYSDISMMRYVLRFYGFLPALDAATRSPSGCWAGSPPYSPSWKDGRITKLADIMAWSMVFYHPLEHVAYVSWKMPKVLHRVNGNKWSAWSCRFWLVFILADWASSFLKNVELLDYRNKILLVQDGQGQDETSSSSSSKGSDDNDSTHLKLRDVDKAILMNRLQMIRNFFFAPPCLSWSLYDTDPLLSENVVNGMSLAEAVVCLYQTMLCL